MVKAKVIFSSVVIVSILMGQTTVAQIKLPNNPQTTKCSISKTSFKEWFVNKKIRKNGKVFPADSLGFPSNNTDCDFYKWSSQMFLWLTSPAGTYGGKGHVFDSSIFFNVSPEENKKRKLIPNVGGNGDAVVKRFILRSPKAAQEIEEVGQAGGGGVLMSQGFSLVYYGIHVNDVYAYFLTGQKNNKISAKSFPHTKKGIKAVENYVKRLGIASLPDYSALTMELKTSWIDATTVSDPAKYITIRAEVPKYVVSASDIFPPRWVLDGTQVKTLALVGMHVVGTVKGHPEMVWATFEHINNAPNNDYQYTNDKNKISSVSYESKGEWLFMETGGSKMFANIELMKLDADPNDSTGSIVAKDNLFWPSNTYRKNPWGSAPTQKAPNNKVIAGNNAQLISLNNDVLGFLSKGDVRKNYFLSGAIWTENGHLPYYTKKEPGLTFTEEGSLNLANTTMETYHQATQASGVNNVTGCFSCHSMSGAHAKKGEGIRVSHIYHELQPLFVDKK